MFKPFNRLSARRTEVPGHGLGLVISRQLVERMHGQLHVSSSPSVGSRFTVQLPLAGNAPADAATPLAPDMPSQWQTGRHHVLKILRSDARTCGIPCVAMRADAMPAHIRRTLSAGFDDYWPKPLEPTAVIPRLKGLFR